MTVKQSKHVMTQNSLNQEDSEGVFGLRLPASDWERAVPGCSGKSWEGVRGGPPPITGLALDAFLARVSGALGMPLGPLFTREVWAEQDQGQLHRELRTSWRGVAGWGWGW